LDEAAARDGAFVAGDQKLAVLGIGVAVIDRILRLVLSTSLPSIGLLRL